MWRAGQLFIFGARPTNADFAFFGQLRQCAADPLPSRVMHDYPAAWSYVWMMDELGGLEPPAWEAPETKNEAMLSLLRLAGQTYLPFLRANAAAYADGQKEVTSAIRGGKVNHTQPTFRYQATYCWPKLQAQYQALSAHPREQAFVRGVLAETGCLEHIEGDGAGGQTRAML